MFSIFNKTKDRPSGNLINLLKKNDVSEVVEKLIKSEDTQYLGPSSGYKIMMDESFDFLDLGDRIALDYINRVGVCNKNLTNRLWTKDLKKIATFEIFLGIRKGISSYSLGKNLEEKLKVKFPEDFLEATARTELAYEFSHSKIDTMLSEASILPGAQGFVKIELSPMHKEKDICDFLEGTYKIENAPITPFHFDCNCILTTFFEPKNSSIIDTTIDEQLKSYSGKENIKEIEMVTN